MIEEQSIGSMFGHAKMLGFFRIVAEVMGVPIDRHECHHLWVSRLTTRLSTAPS